jgi:hypothetical protein
LLGSGCASTDDLKRERDVLSAELSAQRNKNEQLTADNTKLAEQLAFMKTVAANLKTEKEVRTEETAMVRSEVRSFIRKQVEAVRQFSYNSKLTDSIGGEVINRSQLEGENLVLVDMQHTCNSSGTLVGGRVYARAPMKFQFCTLRPINNELVVIWVSPALSAAKPGVSTHTFEIPVNVEKGDRLGLMAAGAIQVPYDIGTGDVRSYTGTLKEGSRINTNDLRGRELRNYSFSFLGFMD